MIQTKNFTSILTLIMGMISVSVFLTGCNNEVVDGPDGYPPVFTEIGYYIFEDKSGAGSEYMSSQPYEDKVQCFQYDGNEHTITLSLKSITEPGLSMPENFVIGSVTEQTGSEDASVTFGVVEDYRSDGFIHIWTDHENGEPMIKIKLEKNNTGQRRHISMEIVANPSQYEMVKIVSIHKKVFAAVIDIIQSPLDNEPETFTLKAQYKGRDYQTEASIDEEGNLIFANPEYAELMQTIDAAPNVEMMILNSETFYYYDADDVSDNRPYHDIMALKPGARSTRATGFEDFEYSDLGYVALYDNDHFEGKHISKGLDNFHFTWNLPNLKDYDMNDKVTSIATLFNSDDPLVCTVLTIWDDTDYNNGDDNRKKHRVSIVACSQAPFVAVEDLKKVKKIGSSKSWNDCISSISFHFGYIDRLLLDY